MTQNSCCDGGGVFLDEGNLILEGCTFYDNAAQVWGGAVFAENSSVTIRRCTFFNNSGGDGSTIRLFNGSLTITSSIFSWGRGSHAINKTGPAPTIRNCLFYGNGTNGQNLFGNVPTGFGAITDSNSNGTPCDRYANIFLNPLYADTGASDLSLLLESPCINAGDSSLSHDADRSNADIGAHPRLFLPSALDRSQFTTAVLFPPTPNPFNPATRLTFELKEAGAVKLQIFDLNGREVETVASGVFLRGVHQVSWDAGALPSGTYFAVLESGPTRALQKLLLLK